MAFGVRIAPQDQAERKKANAKRPGWHGRTTLTGAITALSGQTLTLRVTDGTTHTLGITTSTTVYRVVAATPTQLRAGAFVTVSAATVAGRKVATDVVGTTTAGTMASIVSSAGAATGPTF